MTVQEKLKSTKATIQQIAILTGIPADRMYKWKRGINNPSASDEEKIDETIQFISKMDTQEIKKVVKSVLEKNPPKGVGETPEEVLSLPPSQNNDGDINNASKSSDAPRSSGTTSDHTQQNDQAMEFMKETINWQREFMHLMLSKIPDAKRPKEKEIHEEHERPGKASGM